MRCLFWNSETIKVLFHTSQILLYIFYFLLFFFCFFLHWLYFIKKYILYKKQLRNPTTVAKIRKAWKLKLEQSDNFFFFLNNYLLRRITVLRNHLSMYDQVYNSMIRRVEKLSIGRTPNISRLGQEAIFFSDTYSWEYMKVPDLNLVG